MPKVRKNQIKHHHFDIVNTW